jgi:hypothetical protein
MCKLHGGFSLMRLLAIITLIIAAAGGAYYYSEHQAAPPPKLAELPPPPPPPPPPPTLSQEQVLDLRRKLYDTNGAIRSTALEQVGTFAGEDAEELILERLRFDEDTSIRIQSIALLVRRRKVQKDNAEDERLSELIAQGLRDTNASVKISTLQGLREVAGRSQSSSVSLALFDVNPSVRREAMFTLNAFMNVGTDGRPAVLRYELPDEYQNVWNKAMAHAGRATQ